MNINDLQKLAFFVAPQHFLLAIFTEAVLQLRQCCTAT
jgi:hypothetical protein